MLTANLIALLIVSAASLIEFRRLRIAVERFARVRIGVASVAEYVVLEDAVSKAWEAFVAAQAARRGEDDYSSDAKAQLAAERSLAKQKHDRLLLRLNRIRQADADVRSCHKTLEDVERELRPTLDDFLSLTT
jgi:hypothetical protein